MVCGGNNDSGGSLRSSWGYSGGPAAWYGGEIGGDRGSGCDTRGLYVNAKTHDDRWFGTRIQNP